MLIKKEPSNVKTARDVNDTNMNTFDKMFDSQNQQKKVNDLSSIDNNNNKPVQGSSQVGKENAHLALPLKANDLATNLQQKRDSTNTYGRFLKAVVFITIFIQYLAYVLVIEINALTIKNAPYSIIRLILFHFLFLLMIACLYSTIRTNPGTIPLYWGFYIGDDEFKKKRYCLLCQVFKPDRTHHCSICNVCVLNMDHHCPWINSCIGFYNRKFFVQLLFYFLLIVLYLDIAYIPSIYRTCMILYRFRHSKNYMLFIKASFIFFNYAVALGLTGLDIFFFKFHIGLVMSNCSTIESLDDEFVLNNKYNLGSMKNWEQVFGKNKLFWFFPFLHESAFPDGDGLNWAVNSLAEELSAKKDQRAHDNKSGSTNISFLKQISSNYSTNINNTNYGSNNTHIQKESDYHLDQIIEMSQKT